MIRRFKFGYKFEKMQIHIVEEEVKIIREMFSDYIAGMSTNDIANKLNKQPIRYSADSKEWMRCYVSNIFKDEAYIGDNDYPPVIDRETYEVVQNLIKENGHRIPEEEKPYAEVFKDKTRCSICGSVIIRKTLLKGQKDSVMMKCVNQSCECRKVKIPLVLLETYITKLFTKLSKNIDLIENEDFEIEDINKNEEIIRITNNLRIKMQSSTVGEDRIISDIMDTASTRFDTCTTSNNQKVTERIKELILNYTECSRVEAEYIDEAIQRIILAPGKMITVRFKNGREFTERMYKI